jgi:hypothetical protein
VVEVDNVHERSPRAISSAEEEAGKIGHVVGVYIGVDVAGCIEPEGDLTIGLQDALQGQLHQVTEECASQLLTLGRFFDSLVKVNDQVSAQLCITVEKSLMVFGIDDRMAYLFLVMWHSWKVWVRP